MNEGQNYSFHIFFPVAGCMSGDILDEDHMNGEYTYITTK